MPTVFGYTVRTATDADAPIVRRLAELDSSPALSGTVLIGEVAGEPAAALSLGDGRVVADPFVRSDHLVACLRLHARGLRAHEETPSVADRVRAALRPDRRAGVTASA
jgi:hypothetical protein